MPDVIQGFRLVKLYPFHIYDFAAKVHLGVVWLTFTTRQVNYGGGLCLDCYTWSITDLMSELKHVDPISSGYRIGCALVPNKDCDDIHQKYFVFSVSCSNVEDND